MKALIIVDIQNDFLPGGPLRSARRRSGNPVTNAVQPYFDLIVATQDWHPADHGSFAANHEELTPGQVIDLNGLDQILWPVHCVQNSQGAEFAAELDTSKWAKVFPKGTDSGIDSYSGFFDNGHRKSTGLTDYLKAQGVTSVYVLGLATDYCVKFTALDALNEGFQTYLITDGTRGVNLQAGDSDAAIQEMADAESCSQAVTQLPAEKL